MSFIKIEPIIHDNPTIWYTYKPESNITPFEIAEIVPFLIKASRHLQEAFVGDKITGDLFDKLSVDSKRHFIK
jgi:hypothetical protein